MMFQFVLIFQYVLFGWVFKSLLIRMMKKEGELFQIYIIKCFFVILSKEVMEVMVVVFRYEYEVFEELLYIILYLKDIDKLRVDDDVWKDCQLLFE